MVTLQQVDRFDSCPGYSGRQMTGETMRITCRWIDTEGKNGRMPGRFGTVYDAEKAAAAFMSKHPTVASVAISHETCGTVRYIERPN